MMLFRFWAVLSLTWCSSRKLPADCLWSPTTVCPQIKGEQLLTSLNLTLQNILLCFLLTLSYQSAQNNWKKRSLQHYLRHQLEEKLGKAVRLTYTKCLLPLDIHTLISSSGNIGAHHCHLKKKKRSKQWEKQFKILPNCLQKKKKCLFERQCYTERGIHRGIEGGWVGNTKKKVSEIFLIHWFTPQMAAWSRDGPGWNHKLHLGLPGGCEHPDTWAIFCCLPRCVNQKFFQK